LLNSEDWILSGEFRVLTLDPWLPGIQS
jgi:hypothetical protein